MYAARSSSLQQNVPGLSAWVGLRNLEVVKLAVYRMQDEDHLYTALLQLLHRSRRTVNLFGARREHLFPELIAQRRKSLAPDILRKLAVRGVLLELGPHPHIPVRFDDEQFADVALESEPRPVWPWLPLQHR